MLAARQRCPLKDSSGSLRPNGRAGIRVPGPDRSSLVWLLHFDRCHLLDELDDRRVIQVALAIVHQRHQDVLHGAGQRERNLQRFRGEQRVPQVLLMQTDAEARLEVARVSVGSSSASSTSRPAPAERSSSTTSIGSARRT